MRQLTFACGLLASYVGASWVAAQTPGLIDRPSPPPCAADGMCYPNTESWGYYPGRWRTWPGVELEPVAAPPGPTPADLGPELVPHETPPPELEDQQAPPASPRRQLAPAAPQPATEESESEATPTDTPPPADQPTSDVDPPPALPLSFSIGTRPHAANAASATNDPPPAPPWEHRASL